MIQVMILSVLSIVIGLLGLKLMIQITHFLTKRPVSFSKLTQELRAKLWMTACLGLFFACLYIFVVYLASWALEGEIRQDLFNAVYHHPTTFIYGGLALFSSISLGILVVRSLIKRVYNSKR
jgi:hypothetical protein